MMTAESREKLKIKALAKENGITSYDDERLNVCIIGMELHVFRDEDIVYVLRDAKEISDCNRRLRQRIFADS